MDRAALEGLRQRYAAMRGGQIIYAVDLSHVLDALLAEPGALVRAIGSGEIAGLHWESLDQMRKAAMRELILERYCVPLENWSA